MKTLRYIAFIPSFILTLVLTNLILTYLVKFINVFSELESPTYIIFLKSVLVIIVASYASIFVFPQERKKIPLIISVIFSLIFCLGKIFVLYYFSKADIKPSSDTFFSEIVGVIGFFVGSIYIVWQLKKDNYYI